MKLICFGCGIEFERNVIYKRSKNTFCNRTCALKKVRTKEHQIKASKIAGAKNIERLRGTGTKSYVKEYGRHQHRVVMERILGRKLVKGEIVHHKDENKKNNDPDNLVVMTQSEHCILHFKEARQKKREAV
jgi:hypothetical protein